MLENITVYSIFILIMTVLIFYRGRAELLGQSLEKKIQEERLDSLFAGLAMAGDKRIVEQPGSLKV